VSDNSAAVRKKATLPVLKRKTTGRGSSPAIRLASIGIPGKVPDTLTPVLATLVSGPPPNYEDWVFEIKFDG
jgi:bifunctional non-homologous end joining protein LigD